MTTKASLLACLAVAASALSCEKTAPTFAGTVCMDLQHHGVPFAGATVYHVSNRAESPGFAENMEELYTRSERTGLRSTACFDSLAVGQHHFAARGYDDDIRQWILGEFEIFLTVADRRVDTVMQVSETH